jgi:hypothetical protein
MVKYLAIAAALTLSLMVADQAQARGHRRGCSSCGGCPGGVCAVPVAPGKDMYGNVPPGAMPVAAATTPAATVAATQPVPSNYYASNTTRRGLFGWRR